MSDPEWLRKYKPLNDALVVEYGWFVAPYMIGSDFQRVEKAVDGILKNSPKTDDDRERNEDAIYQSLIQVVFHPNFRARGVWYGLQLKHFREYSHLYESGIFAYYKREYIASVLCLLAALEGILLSHYGWGIQSAQQKPSIPDLITAVRSAKSSGPVELIIDHDLFRDTLADFLDRWI